MGLWKYIFGVDEEQARLADNATAQAKQSAFLHYTRGEWTLAQYNSTIKGHVVSIKIRRSLRT